MIQKFVDQLTDKLKEEFGKLDVLGALRAQLDYQDRLLKSSRRQEDLLRELVERAMRADRETGTPVITAVLSETQAGRRHGKKAKR